MQRSEPYFYALDLDLSLVGQQIAEVSPTIAAAPESVTLSFREPTTELPAAVIVDLSGLTKVSLSEFYHTANQALRNLGIRGDEVYLDFQLGTIAVPVELSSQSASRKVKRYDSVTLQLAP